MNCELGLDRYKKKQSNKTLGTLFFLYLFYEVSTHLQITYKLFSKYKKKWLSMSEDENKIDS